MKALKTFSIACLVLAFAGSASAVIARFPGHVGDGGPTKAATQRPEAASAERAPWNAVAQWVPAARLGELEGARPNPQPFMFSREKAIESPAADMSSVAWAVAGMLLLGLAVSRRCKPESSAG